MSGKNIIKNNCSFRVLINEFLRDRLQTKLDKLAPDDPKRADLIAQHERVPWLEDAARRVKQIQAVTHSLKPIHPDARGTNLYVTPTELPVLDVVGSHILGNHFSTDVVGNAAALDVHRLLKLEMNGRTLLKALIDNDPDAVQSLDDDPAKAQSLREAFTSLTSKREGGAASHVRAKQLYWLVGGDAEDDAQYHLISPLFATSLIHVVHAEQQDARFGQANKRARHARRDGLPHEGVYREYRDLAVQKLGGTQPQNVSQLNAERGGINYLLSSLPPTWETRRNVLPANVSSIFERAFGARPLVRVLIRQMQDLLLSDRPNNLQARKRLKDLENRIIDELVAYAGELLKEPPGWTRDPRFAELADEEKLWLDPLRSELPEESEFASRWLFMDWPAQIGERFGKWLTAKMANKLDHNVSRNWRDALLSDKSSYMEHLRMLRERLDAPKYIPVRKTHDELISLRERK
ncbi:type I-F CRISPR-associated protein Csy1 [Caballeronia concitans]|uniref:CRISPR-associated protein Csy1 n=1 Tax=Caballeronia concitans TaxID=1777133 RepID=A0A658R1P4_9BURK|nr:type I-F CRISPR-associated protein Csy1 [Caballeronia concitans]KIG08618.1 CRISPR-associated protein, Csy1 family [Burkholderia sp. MR1]SAL40373.1 CRISPR-associated protein Csy1 [Caballeronia concitans]